MVVIVNRSFQKFVDCIRSDRSLCRARATALTRILASADISAQLERTRNTKNIPTHAEELVTLFEALMFEPGAEMRLEPKLVALARQHRNVLVQSDHLQYTLLVLAEAYFAAGAHVSASLIDDTVRKEYMRRTARIVELIEAPIDGWPTTVVQLNKLVWDRMATIEPCEKILRLVEPIINASWFRKQQRKTSPKQLLDYVKEQLTPNLQAAL